MFVSTSPRTYVTYLLMCITYLFVCIYPTKEFLRNDYPRVSVSETAGDQIERK